MLWRQERKRHVVQQADGEHVEAFQSPWAVQALTCQQRGLCSPLRIVGSVQGSPEDETAMHEGILMLPGVPIQATI